MAFYSLSFRVSYFAMLIFMVTLLLFATISLSCASMVPQSSSEITETSLQTTPLTSTLARQESSSEKEKQNEMNRMSARLNILEQHISQMNEKINRMNNLEALIDQKNSELETKIMDRVSLLLSTIDMKIIEQTKQIKDISEMIKGECPPLVISTTPLPALITSTTSVSTSNTITSETKKPRVTISSRFYENECKYSANSNEVKCEKVPLEKVKEFFQRTDLFADSQLLRYIQLTLPIGDDFIPTDILGNKATEGLFIDGYYNNLKHVPIALLKVDVNAFQSTKNYTKSLRLRNLDGSQLDWGFLLGFNQLTNLTLVTVYHVEKSLPTFPLLPKLTLLELNDVRGLNTDSIITFPTLSTGGLKTFAFRQSEKHSDASVSRILDWILLSSSKTLEILKISLIGITEIPSQIPSFTALTYLNLGSNSISTIKNGALIFSVPVSTLELGQNKINSIEPGAFQGDFSNAAVDLDSNSLTRFDEPVFRPMLEQMVSGTGNIRLFNNRIDCSTENFCHLAWFVRDGKMREKVWARCLNGTRFNGLSENGFNHCPVP